MYSNEVIQLTQQALWLILLLGGPPVVAASVVGLIIAFIQSATQLQEQTFQYAAKFFAVVLTIFITATVLSSTLYEFSNQLFSTFPALTAG